MAGSQDHERKTGNIAGATRDESPCIAYKEKAARGTRAAYITDRYLADSLFPASNSKSDQTNKTAQKSDDAARFGYCRN